MKHWIFLMMAMAGCSLLLGAQDARDEVLMTIGDQEISIEEFERIYHKNNSSTALEQQSVEEYLELFINFKLKVIEAENLGMDTLPGFIKEFNGYRSQLAKPYLSDKEEVDLLVQEAFERAQKEVKASHILIRLSEDASEEDTMAVYNKALAIRDRILAGEDFRQVAMGTSDDPSVKNNGGELGWFTVFQMVYPFETAAYKTPKGGISMPARSRFGYHIIRTEDIREARGEVRVAHIMVMVPESMSEEEKSGARDKIHSLRDSIEAGLPFETVARQYSEDRGSAGRGGELPWFGTGRMVDEFEDASFSLQNIGDISAPMQTSFGWHIIKLLEKKTYDDFEAVKADLQSKVTKSDRNTFAKKAMVNRIKQRNGFEEFRGSLSEFKNVIDTTFFMRQWDSAKASHLGSPLFKIGNRTLTQQDFTGYLFANQATRRIPVSTLINQRYERFVEQEVLRYEEEQLPEKYPEFRHLVQEYHDGILLFDLTDQMVWSKAVEDTAGLKQFFQENAAGYQWDKRMDATIFSARDQEVAAYAMRLIRDHRRSVPEPEAILQAAIRNFGDSSCLSFEKRLLEEGDHDLIEGMDWKQKLSQSMLSGGDRILFLMNSGTRKPEPKKLDEARGLVTADYQNFLEIKWVEKLRNKYTVKVNRELLSTIE